MRVDALPIETERPNSLKVLRETSVCMDDWSLIRHIPGGTFGYTEKLSPEPVQLTDTNWPYLVCLGVVKVTIDRHIHDMAAGRSFSPRSFKGEENPISILKAIANHEHLRAQRIANVNYIDTDQYVAEKQRLFDKLIKELKNKKRLNAIRDAWQILVNRPAEIKSSDSMIAENLRGLMLYSSRPDRFLAGFQGRNPLWKKVEMHNVDARTGVSPYHASTPFIEALALINNPSLVKVLPQRIPSPGAKEISGLPNSPSVADSLVQVWYRQKYVLNPDGTEVGLKDILDVEKMIIMEQQNWVLALSRCSNGSDFTTIINLNDGTGYSSEMMSKVLSGEFEGSENIENSKLARYVAFIYRSLICGTGVNKIKTIKEKQEYQGERLVIPHITRGHRRALVRGSISLEQLLALEELVQRGIRVPLPGEGETIVLPHIRPAGALKAISLAPKVVRNYHQSEAFDPDEFKNKSGGGVLTQKSIDEIRQKILAR